MQAYQLFRYLSTKARWTHMHHRMKSHKVTSTSVQAAEMPVVNSKNRCSLGDPDHRPDEQGGKASLSFLLLSSFLFPMLKWLKLGWMRFHPNGLHFFFIDVKAGATKKHQPHKCFPALVTTSLLMLRSQVSTAQLKMDFVRLWRSTWPTAFLKDHIIIPTVAAHALWPPKPHPGQNGTDLCPLRPIPRPVSQQQAWPSDEKVRVLLAPLFSKSTLTLIVLANSLEFPSLPRRQSILWKWKLILTGGLSLGVFSIIY